jgi:5-formyltetrahydrofolate cyclo-ligase
MTPWESPYGHNFPLTILYLNIMLKADARTYYRDKRMALSNAERVKLDDLLLIQFQTLKLPFIQTLLSYWPIEENKEPNTHLFNDYIEFKNPDLKICYPKTDFKKTMLTAVLTDEDTKFKKNKYHIYEPVQADVIGPGEIDLIFVPLLCFDKDGFRLGYGKGFYDKYLWQCSRECIIVGFSYFEPVDKLEDRNNFDVPLTACITPQKVYDF